jgi:hypothetical protein
MMPNKILAILIISVFTAICTTGVTAFGASNVSVSQATVPATEKLDYQGVHFTFGSQDGDLVYDCTNEIFPASGDLAVVCSRPHAPTDVWKFTVHLRLFKHERPTAPKLSYELLYWVTDEQLIGGKPGQFTGSTIWFNLAESTPLTSLDAGQDIENTMVLNLHVDL